MKPIITGLASYGMSGSLFHAPFLSTNPGYDLKFVVERTKNNAAARYPNISTLRSFDRLLEETEVELVVVNTPDVTHYEYTKKALLAGKHVVVEKPFVFTVAEGEELIALGGKADALRVSKQAMGRRLSHRAENTPRRHSGARGRVLLVIPALPQLYPAGHLEGGSRQSRWHHIQPRFAHGRPGRSPLRNATGRIRRHRSPPRGQCGRRLLQYSAPLSGAESLCPGKLSGS